MIHQQMQMREVHGTRYASRRPAVPTLRVIAHDQTV